MQIHTTHTISLQERINWIRLARSENVGKSTFFRLLDIYGNAGSALEKISEQSLQGGLGRKIKVCPQAQAEQELALTHKFGAQMLLFCEQDYPTLLREIDDPAPILTVKGKIELLKQHGVAIVGPRNASFNGIAFARKMAADLGDNALIVNSGLAKGIDAAAHKAALNTGTIAVIAGGINHVYPLENADLYRQIFNQGLIVSESPFGVPPKGGNFIQRNRIISGISLGTIVVEAGLRSGSLTTARFANEQGREVFSVPGSPFDPRCHGTNRLIKQGAKLTENIDDVLEEILAIKNAADKGAMLQEPQSEGFISVSPKTPSQQEVKEVRDVIVSKLSFMPIAIEDIVQELNAPARLVNIAVIQLELADKVEVKFGKVSLKVG